MATHHTVAAHIIGLGIPLLAAGWPGIVALVPAWRRRALGDDD